MKMTRQHFELIADIINDLELIEGGTETEALRKDIGRAFADKLAYTNSSFNRHKFLLRCGIAL